MDEFTKQLANKLGELNIDVEVYTEYVSGIVEDERMSLDERREALIETLQSVLIDVSDYATTTSQEDALVVATDVAEQVLVFWEQAKVVKAEEEERRRIEDKKLIDGVAAVGHSPQKQQTTNNYITTTISRQDADIKKRLVAQFGCQVDETVEFGEDGELMRPFLKVSGDGKKTDAELSEMIGGRNDNREMVKQKAQQEREKAKVEHDGDIRRRTEQKQKEQLKKEKEKQRVSKNERKSGR
eukprot:GHVS01097643.1.p1 GENE.GHVS01097643.1~~GHVS01097643.1.p1  ORF type:complete len:241 (+),score=70.73 GHVS01097643.1:59-781(+)